MIIDIEYIQANGSVHNFHLSGDTDSSLMEALNEVGLPLPAICGGLAICSTCTVRVLSGLDVLPPPDEQELTALDYLPDREDDCRLSCQLKLRDLKNGMVFQEFAF